MASAKSSLELEELSQVMGEMKSKVEELVCQVCKGYPRPSEPKWYKCSENHRICQLCVESEKIGVCPCRGKISKNADEMTEALLKLKTTMFKCQHCDEKFTKETFSRHEVECIMRLVPCPFIGSNMAGPTRQCHQRIPFQNVIQHYELKHVNYENVPNGLPCINYIGKVWTKSSQDHWLWRGPFKVEAYGKVFLNLTLMSSKGIWYEWVQLLGSRKEAEDFVFSLEYNGPKNTHVFLGEVASIDETPGAIIRTGKFSSIAFESFKLQFLEEDTNYPNYSKYSGSITIKKLSEETQTN